MAAYESWVNSTSISGGAHTTMTYSSYRYVYDSSFRDMSDNFAGLAKSSYGTCVKFESYNQTFVNEAIVATKNNLTRCQRAVCGLLNRFYYNAKLN